MITVSSRLTAIAFVSVFLTSSALAQTTPATAPKMAPAEQKTEKPRTPESIECSNQADAKGLHGKERKKFERKCKKEARKPADKKM